jgi:hypothetical protein
MAITIIVFLFLSATLSLLSESLEGQKCKQFVTSDSEPIALLRMTVVMVAKRGPFYAFGVVRKCRVNFAVALVSPLDHRGHYGHTMGQIDIDASDLLSS